MSPTRPPRVRRPLVVLLALLGAAPAAAALPTAAAVDELLRREPVAAATWPAWRDRLRGWMGDRSHATDAAFEAARAFVRGQAGPDGKLPPALADDALAWYLLARSWLDEAKSGDELRAAASRAEDALRGSVRIDPKLAQAHRHLALVLLLQEPPENPNAPFSPRPAASTRREEARKELAAAREADPALPLKWVEAQAALVRRSYVEAENLFGKALVEEPAESGYARGAALAVVSDPKGPGARAPRVRVLRDRFPDDGVLTCLYGAALFIDGDPRGAARQLDAARRLGTDPEEVLPRDLVAEVRRQAAPGPLELLAWVMGGFAAFYAAVMALMALSGLVLARRTRGARALDLLGGGAEGEGLVAGGQVVRTGHESSLGRLYALALFAGLLLFYVSVPFVLVGILAATGLLLYLIFSLGRIPIKLVVLVAVMGLGGAWAVLRSLFAAPARGAFGVPKTAEQCPRLHAALGEVARRVDTSPVDAVYLAPGSEIGVHQEGRGPFGVFGVKRRVLTLGLSTMHFLTVGELKSILAHEYAHFSHADTFYNRFIYQVSLSIQSALNGMGAAGGRLNYVNPFFWFLYLYYKAFRLLSAGYSRSREFLADRMACLLYGGDVFTGALTKVCTDGTLFEMTMYQSVDGLLNEGKSFVNVYTAFRTFRDEQMDGKEREELYQKLLGEGGSVFASHPTFKERVEAAEGLPPARQREDGPALDLFDGAEELEKEMTEFLTGYVHHARQLRVQAGAG